MADENNPIANFFPANDLDSADPKGRLDILALKVLDRKFASNPAYQAMRPLASGLLGSLQFPRFDQAEPKAKGRKAHARSRKP